MIFTIFWQLPILFPASLYSVQNIFHVGVGFMVPAGTSLGCTMTRTFAIIKSHQAAHPRPGSYLYETEFPHNQTIMYGA